jgi:hypothetical protein
MTMTAQRSTRTPAPILDAIAMLEADHASARELLAMLLRMKHGGRNRERVVFVLSEDLWIHMQIEEELFYPAVFATGSGLSDPPTVRDALREALAELERYPADGQELTALVKRVLDLHEEDSGEEERHVFAHARRALSGEMLIALGDRMRARRQELRESGAVRRERVLEQARSHTPGT